MGWAAEQQQAGVGQPHLEDAPPEMWGHKPALPATLHADVQQPGSCTWWPGAPGPGLHSLAGTQRERQEGSWRALAESSLAAQAEGPGGKVQVRASAQMPFSAWSSWGSCEKAVLCICQRS